MALRYESPVTQRSDEPPPRRWRRELLGAVLLAGLLCMLAVAARPTLGATASALGHLDWAWIPLAVLAEASSMAAFACAQRRLLRSGGIRLHLTLVTAGTYAGNAISVSVPVAGAEAGTAFAFRQFRKHGVSAAAASWALAVSGLVSSLAFALVLAAGSVASGSPAAAAAGLAGAALSLAPVAAILLALRSRRAAGRFGVRGDPAPVRSGDRTRDQDLAGRLWQVSEQMTGVTYTFTGSPSS